jgi:hypothetical protein
VIPVTSVAVQPAIASEQATILHSGGQTAKKRSFSLSREEKKKLEWKKNEPFMCSQLLPLQLQAYRAANPVLQLELWQQWRACGVNLTLAAFAAAGAIQRRSTCIALAPPPLNTSVFTCDQLSTCDVTCGGPDRDLLDAATFRSGCASEQFLHAHALRIIVIMLLVASLNGGRLLFIAGLHQLWWRDLTMDGDGRQTVWLTRSVSVDGNDKWVAEANSAETQTLLRSSPSKPVTVGQRRRQPNTARGENSGLMTKGTLVDTTLGASERREYSEELIKLNTNRQVKGTIMILLALVLQLPVVVVLSLI